LIALAAAMDGVMGDPEWFPHPVRLMGAGIRRGEKALRREGQSAASELAAGALLTVGLVTASYVVTRGVIGLAYRMGDGCGGCVEVGLGWTCLAARNLQDEAGSVVRALESGDLALARGRVARIVGRDTDRLDVGEVSRAVIETVAESASDGVIAPLFYMAMGGVPLAMAYKAVNTLDSMIGHADERYFYLGKVAARLDDVANLVPARLSALGVVGAAALGGDGDAASAWRTWLRDGGEHTSPNAGQPESAMAGALQVRLGGVNSYRGEVVESAVMGVEFAEASPEKARRAVRMVGLVSLLGIGAACVAAALLERRRSA
jgi:adenosylcobinamide-phosphate synthase